MSGEYTYLLNLVKPEITPFDLPTPKTPPQNETWSGSGDPWRRYGHLKISPMRALRGQSVAGRSSNTQILVGRSSYTDYTPLRYVTNVAREE